MGNLSALTIAAWVVLGLVGWFFAVRFLDQGVRSLSWSVRRLYRAIERATDGKLKIPPDAHRRVAEFTGRKIKGWVGYAVGVILEPFVEIVRSFIPRYELVPLEAATATLATVQAPAAPPSAPPSTPLVETLTPPPAAGTPPARPAIASDGRPGEADYLTAVAWFELPANCSATAAAKAWAKRAKGDSAAQANVAYVVICEYRNFRRD